MRLKCQLIIMIIVLSVSACNSPSLRNNISSETAATVDDTTTLVSGQSVDKAISEVDLINKKQINHKQPSPGQKTSSDIWIRIQNNLVFDRHHAQRIVKDKLNWYVRNQDYIDRVIDRANPYIFYIVTELEKRNMPLELALLPIVESAYHPFAYSPSRASGIWQFIPSTGKLYGLKQNWWYDGRRDIIASTRAALDYLQKLHKEFSGDWLLALAAYNTGEGNVAKAIRRNKKTGKKTDFWSLRLPRETRGYVPSLLAVAELIANPEKYGIKWKAIPNKPYFVQVNTEKQLDLALAAKLAQLSMDQIYTLNPAFNRWATDPNGPHFLLLPIEKEQAFSEKLVLLTENERIKWKRHIIKRGESLGLIANRYKTSIATLKQTNGLRSNLIREGRSLLIPTSKQPLNYYTLSLDSRRFRGLKKTGSGEQYTYTVKRGDTLWDIGIHYGVSVRQLCAWNGISSRGIIRKGQSLTLWFSDSGQDSPDKSLSIASTQSLPVALHYDSNSKTTYTVKKGDSLWLISKRYKIKVAQLRQWNSLPKGKYLQPGQKLILHKKNTQITGV